MIIEAHDVSVAIGKRRIVNDASFTCREGDSLALIGRSGSGKTTLLNALGGLLPISGGRLLVDGDDMARWSERRRRQFWRMDASFVLQDYGLVDDESVGYNVVLRKTHMRRSSRRAEIADVLDVVGLAHRMDDPVLQLSGGERRRVAIARAIHRRSAVIFADEPTASLDSESRQTVQRLLLDEARRGCVVVISTHDMDLAKACTAQYRLQRLAL